MSPIPPARAAIIADDLTGALDSAAPFAARGLQTVVAVEPGALREALASAASVIVVNTLSRHLGPEAAAAAASEAAERCVAADARIVLKKIDSRMRGEVGAEATAVARVLGADTLVVAPAVPAHGRTVAGGRIFGAGVTAEGIDIRKALTPGLRLEVPDGRNEDDLARVAASCLERGDRVLAVGAHGLASALAGNLAGRHATGPGFVVEQPVLVVVGSQDPATAAQIEVLISRAPSAMLVEAPCGRLPDSPGPARSGIFILRSVPCSTGPEGAGERFADGVAAWVVGARPRTVLATGGDTAAALLQRLGCRTLQVGGEAVPGIPWSRLPDGICLITKSGGFGQTSALLDVLRLPVAAG